MPEFVIEKAVEGLGEMSQVQQDLTIRRSCSVLHGVAPGVEWVQSYVTQDKCYCVFHAPSAQVLWELIEQWELQPPISICEVHQIVHPDGKT
jgi:hypothetical protein